MLRSSFQFVLLAAVSTSIAGCDAVRDQFYGERGIQELVPRDQHLAFREVDLALLLDPSNRRGAKPAVDTAGNLTGEYEVRPNEIDRALTFFANPANNEFENNDAFAAQVSECKERTAPTSKVGTVQITETKVSTAKQKFDLQNNPIAPPTNKIVLSNDYELKIVSTGPVAAPRVCGRQRVQQLRRNAITERLIAASEQQCEQYKDLLSQIDADVSFTTGLITAGLGAAGALVSGASQALSAAAGGVGAGAVAFSQSYFNNRTIGATITAIDADRIAIRTQIRQGLKMVPESYSMEQALGDVARFHYACSLRAGVDALTNTTEDRLTAVRAAAAQFGAATPAEGGETPTPAPTPAPPGAQGQLEGLPSRAEINAASPAAGAGF
ncbi:MAG: hypothetical protein AAGE90_14765 [Pseudomonadota bacterium]